MDSIKRVFLISLYNMKKLLINPRLYIIVILSFLYMQFMLLPVRDFCRNVGIGITPYVFPFFIAASYSAKIISLLAVLLFCNAPFVDSEHPYIILRSSRKKWFAGQIVYIFMAGLLYGFLLVIMNSLIFMPYIQFDGNWGKVINTLAQTGAAVEHGIVVPFDYLIINSYSPFMAMALQMLLCCLIFFLLGNVIFLLNALIGRAAGSVIAVAIILFPMIAEDIAPAITYFSPISWMSLSMLEVHHNSHYPSLQYALCALLFLNVILIGLSFLVMRKRDVEVLKNI